MIWSVKIGSYVNGFRLDKSIEKGVRLGFRLKIPISLCLLPYATLTVDYEWNDALGPRPAIDDDGGSSGTASGG